ncbi:MAG: hypothetical protein IPK82_12265 [Polyangiaceae bacterium]|nr:hypothetical protein [Polyangiaceae bacterium]
MAARKLPMLFSLGATKSPTVDHVRKKLGGRASTDKGAGAVVTLDVGSGLSHTGVVIFINADNVDVWIGDGVVRRATPSAVRPFLDSTPPPLVQVAADATVFGGIVEGQRVRFRHDTGTAEGTVVEKCKFGVLVERDDRSLVGVSFRRVWPMEQN